MRRLTHHSLQPLLYTSNHTRYSPPLYPFLVFSSFYMPPPSLSLLVCSHHGNTQNMLFIMPFIYFSTSPSLPPPTTLSLIEKRINKCKLFYIPSVLLYSPSLSSHSFSLSLILPHHLIPPLYSFFTFFISSLISHSFVNSFFSDMETRGSRRRKLDDDPVAKQEEEKREEEEKEQKRRRKMTLGQALEEERYLQRIVN